MTYRFCNPILMVGMTFFVTACGFDPGKKSDIVIKDRIDDLVDRASEIGVELEDEPGGANFEEAITIALMQSPAVSSAMQAERVAKSSLSAVKSQKNPQLSGNVRAGGLKYDDSSRDIVSGAALNVRLSQLIFDGGLVDGLVQTSEAEIALAGAKKSEVVNEVAMDAASAWASIWQAQESNEVLFALEEELKPYLKQARRMSETGLVDRSLLDNVEQKVLDFELKKEEAVSALRMAKMDFSNYFVNAEKPQSLPQPIFSTETMKTAISDKIVAPSMKVSALELLIDEHKVLTKQADFSPKIFVEMGAVSPMDPDDKSSLQAGLNVTYNVSDGGKRVAELAAARENVKAKRYALAAAKQKFETMTGLILEKIDNLAASMNMMASKLQMSRDKLKVAESQMQTGKSSVLKLVEARVETALVELDLIEKQTMEAKAKFELAALLGLFDKLVTH